MQNNLIFCGGSTQASREAAAYLKSLSLPVVETATKDVAHLILDVPSLGSNGQLRGGGDVESLVNMVNPDAVIYGGYLNHRVFESHRTVDFLQDPAYTAENAYITAECALDVALPYLDRTIRGCPVLIIGWGRIGKCLGQLLKAIGADVTITARNPKDRAMIHALGYHAEDPAYTADSLEHFRLIYNTAPAPMLSEAQLSACHPKCVKIELSSTGGLAGEDVVIARGLPGLHMPESAGRLMAHTFLRYYGKDA